MNDVARAERRLNQRQCFLCRGRKKKTEMLRLVVDDNGQIWPDVLQQAPGRGAYLCMKKECLERLSDKRLGMLRKDFDVQLPQCPKLIERMQEGLYQQLKRLISQYRAVAALGRDAVMHQMWESGPLLLLLAADAGDALIRQIQDAAGKREKSGGETLLLRGFTVAFLAEAFARDKISVAALSTEVVSAKFQLFAIWYERVCNL